MMIQLKLAARNLMRYRRRTVLTVSLITLGVMSVLIFMSVAGSFRNMMIGQITDAMLGHLQLHRKGYVASTDSLPLNLNMSPDTVSQVIQALEKNPAVQAWSPRIKFGAMLSNYTESTNVRLNAVEPQHEWNTVPLLAGRIDGLKGNPFKKGQMLVPKILASGMKIKKGDTVVLVATNRDGSVNGANFQVAGIVESLSGPGGRDGYIHLDDARTLLRLDKQEVTEIAVRLKSLDMLDEVVPGLKKALIKKSSASKKPALELHSWRQLTPFSSIAKMIDLLTLFVQIMLVSIVLISVMNVMVMAVYERIKEIGTIAAMGLRPRTILRLFLWEGLLLGLVGTLVGTAVSLLVILGLNTWEVSYSFGRQQDLILQPTMDVQTIFYVALGVMLVSVAASLQPARKASRMDPTKALRHV